MYLRTQMRRATKKPSEWLKLLCKDWATENAEVVENTDAKFLAYKPYVKGQLTSQLLCRLSIPPNKTDGNNAEASPSTPPVDFWGILGIQDEFDKQYIVAQVERFCGLYTIRGNIDDADGTLFNNDIASPEAVAAAAAAGISVLPSYMDPSTAAAAAVAAVNASDVSSRLTRKQVSEVSKAHRMAKDAEKALENERRQNMKREQKRLSLERKEQKQREREAVAIRKAAERIAREASREERRRKKLEMRQSREKFAQEQKEAALKRAAALVASNRVPIEITRGAAAAKAAANAALASAGAPVEDSNMPLKKSRSAIVVSTAADLHAIVTHSKNLWAKVSPFHALIGFVPCAIGRMHFCYVLTPARSFCFVMQYNAIAKEHNQKVNWITVAKELGIHVKVREKYARMHSRAEQRGFDWEKNGDWKIKDHPDIFMEPTQAEQKAKMPPPPPSASTTVLIEGNKEVADDVGASATTTTEQVVDAVVPPMKVDTSVVPASEEATRVAAVAATLVADPTANLVDDQATEAAAATTAAATKDEDTSESKAQEV